MDDCATGFAVKVLCVDGLPEVGFFIASAKERFVLGMDADTKSLALVEMDHTVLPGSNVLFNFSAAGEEACKDIHGNTRPNGFYRYGSLGGDPYYDSTNILPPPQQGTLFIGWNTQASSFTMDGEAGLNLRLGNEGKTILNLL